MQMVLYPMVKIKLLKLTGTITSNVDVIVPDSVEKTYVIENATTVVLLQ
jgi:hypothetical protein